MSRKKNKYRTKIVKKIGNKKRSKSLKQKYASCKEYVEKHF